MKRFLLAFVILLLTQNWAAAQRNPGLAGRWYSPYLDRTVRISNDPRSGIRVKGLYRRNKWTWFRYAGKDGFISPPGDRITIIDGDRLIYSSADRRNRITLIPWEYRHDNFRQDRPGNRPPDYGYEENRDSFEAERWATRDKDDFDYSRGSDLSTYRDLEGTWLAEGLGKKVYIVDTRDGLKARLQDDSRWYKYLIAKGNADEYTADDGQKYRWTGQGKLEWTDRTGSKRLVLTKLSDTLE